LPHFKINSLVLIILLPILTEAQTPDFIPLTSLKKLDSAIKINDEMRLMDLEKTVPLIQMDLRYATHNNFTHTRMYPRNTKHSYLRKPAAMAMAAAAKELKEMNLGFRIWDAYRPYHVTVKFWELIHDERYVANPAKGSGHNRGIAVDLTLYDLITGKEISMPTGFDDFSEEAHHGATLADPEKIKNRELLRSIMEKNGFKKFETEWWHYYWPEGQRFEVLDIPFEKLKKRKYAAKG